MIIKEKSEVFVSADNFEYLSVGIKAFDEPGKYFVLSMHTGFNQFDFVPVEKYITETYKGTLVKIVAETSSEKEYSITVTPNHKFYTKSRGYVSASRLNMQDVLLDCENRVCRIKSKEFFTPTEEVDVFNITASYNYNFACNGLIVRS